MPPTKLTQFERYRALELIPPDYSPSRGSRLKNALKVARQWVACLFADPHEPRIRRGIHKNGALFWHVYDPVTGESAHLFEELEVRMWLEERYRYRSALTARHPSRPLPPPSLWR